MKGFTLIEMLIVVAIIGILVALLIPYALSDKHNVSYGINGYVENRCINGLSFIIDQHGRATQVMDTMGKGVACYETK